MGNAIDILDLEKTLRSLNVQKALLYDELSEKIISNDNSGYFEIEDHSPEIRQKFLKYGILSIFIKNKQLELLSLTQNIISDEQKTHSTTMVK